MIFRIHIGKIWYPYQYEALFEIFESFHSIDKGLIQPIRNYLIGCVVNEGLRTGGVFYEWEDDRVKNYLISLSHSIKEIRGKQMTDVMFSENEPASLREYLIDSVANFDRFYSHDDWSPVIYDMYLQLGGSANHVDEIHGLTSYLNVSSNNYYISVINELVKSKEILFNTIIELYEASTDD